MASAPFGARLKVLLLWFKNLAVQVGRLVGSSLDARASLKLSSNQMAPQPVGPDAIATSHHIETLTQEKLMS
jgi:hypothetical protein